MQNQKVVKGVEQVYKSLPQTIAKIASHEGVASLWNGNQAAAQPNAAYTNALFAGHIYYFVLCVYDRSWLGGWVATPGFLPYFARCGGHTVFTFLFLEQYRKIANSHYG